MTELNGQCSMLLFSISVLLKTLVTNLSHFFTFGLGPEMQVPFVMSELYVFMSNFRGLFIINIDNNY